VLRIGWAFMLRRVTVIACAHCRRGSLLTSSTPRSSFLVRYTHTSSCCSVLTCGSARNEHSNGRICSAQRLDNRQYPILPEMLRCVIARLSRTAASIYYVLFFVRYLAEWYGAAPPPPSSSIHTAEADVLVSQAWPPPPNLLPLDHNSYATTTSPNTLVLPALGRNDIANHCTTIYTGRLPSRPPQQSSSRSLGFLVHVEGVSLQGWTWEELLVCLWSFPIGPSAGPELQSQL
jgi:hypothetical protein